MDPRDLSLKIEERYQRYLQTMFYFRDPEFRASFEEGLRSGHLSKGPYLEATPVFEQGLTPRDLFRQILDEEIDEAFLTALQGDRPLYRHQEQAIRHVTAGHNVAVATGTGSGKTESFLYPILLHLYREFRANQLGPGVRALILYPMNALANDQRERLRGICARMHEAGSPFEFTFGQYIGETPEDESDGMRHAQDHLADRERRAFCREENGRIVHGELVLRTEMRATPPHILLTNYSMLEYLLLRPADSKLFDHGRARWWTFLVLDEAHQYRGSRGIEMAMLLRRLKQRLREGGCSGAFRCIATSATLVGETDERQCVADFASDLFGEEPFHPEQIIFGEYATIPDTAHSRLSSTDYEALLQYGSEPHQAHEELLRDVQDKLGIQRGNDEDAATAIGRILQKDSRVRLLRQSLSENPVEYSALAQTVFDDIPEASRESALSTLVQVISQARDPDTQTPLLALRYHLFLRALEGAYVSYLPYKQVFLDRQKLTQDDSIAFEVALCRECGQHYLVGRVEERTFSEAVRDVSSITFGTHFLRPFEEDVDPDILDEEEASQPDLLQLCVQCGAIGRTLSCHPGRSIPVVQEKPPADKDRADQMMRCSACGYNAAGRDPVREVVYGTDGPHAVIATTLYQHLPEHRKKVLAFADGRQEAAFFAWYLESSYRDILHRNLILKAAHRLENFAEDGLSMDDMALALRERLGQFRIVPASAGKLEALRTAWQILYREFLTDEQRISLEGVGLVGWFVWWPEWCIVPEGLLEPPLSLTEQEAWVLLQILFNTMRTSRAVELKTPDMVLLNWEDLSIQAMPLRFCIGKPGGRTGLRSWDGKLGSRARFLTKLIEYRGVSHSEAQDVAVRVLRAIWDTITRSDEQAPTQDESLLLSAGDGRRLNPNWWRLRLVGDTLYRCDTCNRVYHQSLLGICPRHTCSGTLMAIQPDEIVQNHYRMLYSQELPGTLRVEEHTAQLDHERAREFQRAFREGKIHVLSCSTTFELGVDLGDLDTIFLRNVPPESFNYAQRVGRSGRRVGHPGFAVTYCRRGPHDLYHYAQPLRMLKGKASPPVLSLGNEKIVKRHMMATALSSFFRTHPERFKSVSDLLVDMNQPSGVSDFKKYLVDNREEIERCFNAIVPTALIESLGIQNGQWIRHIAGAGQGGIEESRFVYAEAEVASDYQHVRDLEKTSSKKRDHRTAGWAQKRANTIAGEQVLSFLSRTAVIPKYGFPVDVVELDTQQIQQGRDAFSIMLQRDLSLAIAEFAPGGQVIANKKIWTSYGLKKVAAKEWDERCYKRCARHNVFLQWEPGEPEPPTPCEDHLPVRRYLIPRFGFITNRDKPVEPAMRPGRLYTTRPYFAHTLTPDAGVIRFPRDAPVVILRKASPGRMVVLCEGRHEEGFYVCRACGAGFQKRVKAHKTPFGQDCRTLLEQTSLGHEFITDVLQLQFYPPGPGEMGAVWFTYSLAYALLDGAAEVLGVPSTDLNVTVAYESAGHMLPPIILYDNVPGGAGLVARFEERSALLACMKTAFQRVGGDCGCAEDTSCYGCLRSYRNQFAHPYLERGPVSRYLETVLARLTSIHTG